MDCNVGKSGKRTTEDSLRLGSYSLAEVVIILTIIGLFAGIAIPRLGQAIARHSVDGATRRLVADLSFAKQSAKSAGADRTVIFNAAERKYALSEVADNNHSASTYTVYLQRDYGLTTLRFALGGDGKISFDMYGMPDSAGTIYLGKGDHFQSIEIDSDTGHSTSAIIPAIPPTPEDNDPIFDPLPPGGIEVPL